MARHRRRRRRGFGGYVSVPGFGSLKQLNPLGKTVRSTDVAVGAGLGLALGSVVKYLLNTLNVSIGGKIPASIMSYASPISTFLAGVGLYWFQRKSKRARADAHLVGASLAAGAPIFWKLLGDFGPKMADGTPFFSDYVSVPTFGLLTADQPYGLLTRDTAFSGVGEWDPMSAA
jgi:hypothetical protein